MNFKFICELFGCTKEEFFARLFMFKSQSQVACKLDLHLHEVYVSVSLSCPVLKDLLEVHVHLVDRISMRVSDKHNLICRRLCFIYAVLVFAAILFPLNVDAMDHLHIKQLHLHFDVVLDTEVPRVVLLQLLLVLSYPFIETGFDHLLENCFVVVCQSTYELSIGIEEHRVFLVVVVEQCFLEVPATQEVEPRGLGIDVAAFV